MKLSVTLIIVTFVILTLSCSHKITMAHRTFNTGDSNKISSLNFINDTICVYEQQFLFNMPTPYKKVKIICHYAIEKKKLILKNITTNRDSSNVTCFRIPEVDLNRIDFFKPPILTDSIILGKPPTLTRIDLYGFIDNITVDTLIINRHKIYYNKKNDCFQYYMFISKKFLEKQ